jgi:hypothetical protein
VVPQIISRFFGVHLGGTSREKAQGPRMYEMQEPCVVVRAAELLIPQPQSSLPDRPLIWLRPRD